MMKYLVLLMLGCLPILASAQKEVDDRSNHFEIGLNTTQLLRNLFAQNATGRNGTHTLFMKYGRGNGYFRALLGGHVLNKENESSFNGTFVSNSTEVRTALGYERRRLIYKKLELVMGFDLLLGINQAKSKSSFFGNFGQNDVFGIETTNTSFGGGPILGLRYAFSKFFAVSTESSLYVIGSKGAKVNKTNGNEEDRKDFTSLAIQHSLPTDLFFVVTF